VAGFRFDRLLVVPTGSSGFPGEAGLLGMAVLGRFERVVLDLSRGEAFFLPGNTR
jgi:hypothetical protein